MKTVDGLNNLAVIVAVSIAWFLDKIDASVALPVLLALAGLITLPSTVSAAKNALSKPGEPPPAPKDNGGISASVIMLLSTIGSVTVVRFMQILSVVLLGLGLATGCGATGNEDLKRALDAARTVAVEVCHNPPSSKIARACEELAFLLGKHNAGAPALPSAGASGAADDDAGVSR